MRVTFSAQVSRPNINSSFHVPVTVRLRPSAGMMGEHTYTSDNYALRKLLRSQTDLPASVIERFLTQLNSGANAKLCGVELTDRVLQDVGYFVD